MPRREKEVRRLSSVCRSSSAPGPAVSVCDVKRRKGGSESRTTAETSLPDQGCVAVHVCVDLVTSLSVSERQRISPCTGPAAVVHVPLFLALGTRSTSSAPRLSLPVSTLTSRVPSLILRNNSVCRGSVCVF